MYGIAGGEMGGEVDHGEEGELDVAGLDGLALLDLGAAHAEEDSVVVVEFGLAGGGALAG